MDTVDPDTAADAAAPGPAAPRVTWRYRIDPGVDPTGDVPGHAMVGASAIDPGGTATGEFTPNPDYRPSPIAIMVGKVGIDPVVDLFALHAQKRLPAAAFLAEFESLEFSVIARRSDGVLFAGSREGRDLLQVFTAEVFRPLLPDDYVFVTISGAHVASLAAAGSDIHVNPDPAGTLVLPREFFSA
jgi:hypothetical protein